MTNASLLPIRPSRFNHADETTTPFERCSDFNRAGHHVDTYYAWLQP